MTLEERLALAREIAARTPPRFAVDNSREEARRRRFRKIQRLRESAILEIEQARLVKTW